jgi:hypothetical protein
MNLLWYELKLGHDHFPLPLLQINIRCHPIMQLRTVYKT